MPTTHDVDQVKQVAPTFLSGVSIGRLGHKFSGVAVDTVAADADVVVMKRFSGAMVRVATGAVTTLTPHVEGDAAGTDFAPAYDESGTAISMTIASGRWQEVPKALFPAGAIKFVSDVDGTIDIFLKG